MNGERLEELMEASDLEQQEVAQALGVSKATITNYKKCRYELPADFSEKAEAFFAGPATEMLRDRLEKLEKATA